MKEAPLLMCAEMVLATKGDRKTQTRRVVKPQPQTAHMISDGMASLCYPGMIHRPSPYGRPGDTLWVKETHLRWGKWVRKGKTKGGKPAWKFAPAAPNLKKVLYVAGEPIALPEKIKRAELAWHKRPSIFMPRWASRLTLEIVSVRIERAQEISEADAIAEGVMDCGEEIKQLAARVNVGKRPAIGPIEYYECLWDSLNAKRGFSWASNPWVWVIEFKKL